MFEDIKEQIHLGFKGKVVAFFLILFAVYSIIWAVAEPLNIEWIILNKSMWRWILAASTIIITFIAFIYFYPNVVLEHFGAGVHDTDLQSSLMSTGNPMSRIENDGFQGKVVALSGDYDKDEMDWHIKPSAHRATYFIAVYLPSPLLKFYLRIIVVSKDKSISKYVWLRFEPNLSIPDKHFEQEEMAYPITAVNENNFLKTTLDIKKAVKETFGQGGWQYDKTILFRIRGNGKIKSIVFRQ